MVTRTTRWHRRTPAQRGKSSRHSYAQPPGLRRFQERFIRAATAPGVKTAALSLPRGNGKSWLAGHLVARILNPADPLFVAGSESVLLAASLEQARIVWRFARASLGEDAYRYLDSANKGGITHLATRTRLRVISSNARTAMGLVGTPWVIADEPGAWETRGGELMQDALRTARGKPGSPMRVVYLGTVAPSRAGWWPDLIAGGSRGSTHVTCLQGDRETWDRWPTIRRSNPLTAISADFRATLLEERDEARRDSRLKAQFLSYRLNLPTEDESRSVLSVDDWKRTCVREVPERAGRPIVGVDLGGGRSWSAAVALWRSGRCEALAVAPGLPGLEAQEKRDRVPSGTYRALAEGGALRVAEGLRVQPPAELVRAVWSAWGRPDVLVCDRYRLGELQDAVQGRCPIVARVPGWKTGAEDVRALRSIAADGPLSVAPGSRDLLAASLAVALVTEDGMGNTRIAKRGSNSEARDDVAAALVLAAGARSRAPAPRPFRYEILG